MYSDSYSWEYGRRFVLDSDWLTSQCLSAPIFLLLSHFSLFISKSFTTENSHVKHKSKLLLSDTQTYISYLVFTDKRNPIP